jgi:hypothetical protein
VLDRERPLCRLADFLSDPFLVCVLVHPSGYALWIPMGSEVDDHVDSYVVVSVVYRLYPTPRDVTRKPCCGKYHVHRGALTPCLVYPCDRSWREQRLQPVFSHELEHLFRLDSPAVVSRRCVLSP